MLVKFLITPQKSKKNNFFWKLNKTPKNSGFKPNFDFENNLYLYIINLKGCLICRKKEK